MTRTLIPKKSSTDVCYKCPCGCEHWLDSRWLQNGYDLQCYCGKIHKIKPTKVEVRFVTVNSPDKVKPTTQINKRVIDLLKKQGFSVAEAKRMASDIEIDTDNIGVLVKRALQTVEVK